MQIIKFIYLQYSVFTIFTNYNDKLSIKAG